jgi:hypothetical protein
VTSDLETSDLERALRGALLSASSGVTARPDLTDAVRASHRRRRRQRRAVAAVTLAVAVVVTPAGVLLARTDTDRANLVPTAPTPTAAAATAPGPTAVPTATRPTPAAGTSGPVIGGLTVTWLPTGMEPLETSVRTVDDRLGAVAYYGSFHAMVGGRSSFVSLTAEWGPARGLDDVEAALRAVQPSRTFSQTTVRGHPALFSNLADKEEFGLYWVERDGLLIDLVGGTPATVADLRRVADGLVVGDGPPTVNPAVEAAVRSAAAQVFTAGVPAATALAAVDTADTAGTVAGGDSLIVAREQYLLEHPGLARTLAVTVRTVAPRDENHVDIALVVSFTDPSVWLPPSDLSTAQGQPRSINIGGEAVRTPSGWKLTRDIYCMRVYRFCDPVLVARAGSATPTGPAPAASATTRSTRS